MPSSGWRTNMANETKAALELVREVLVELLAVQREMKNDLAGLTTAVVENISELHRRDDSLESGIQRLWLGVNRNDDRLAKLEALTKRQ